MITACSRPGGSEPPPVRLPPGQRELSEFGERNHECAGAHDDLGHVHVREKAAKTRSALTRSPPFQRNPGCGDTMSDFGSVMGAATLGEAATLRGSWALWLQVMLEGF